MCACVCVCVCMCVCACVCVCVNGDMWGGGGGGGVISEYFGEICMSNSVVTIVTCSFNPVL